MSQTTNIEKELRLIRQRLEAIEETLAEEMTKEDKRDLKEAIAEHKQGKSVPFDKVRRF
jgi:predicted  nucleic acid-binding Zn-ribbon protein